jgi:peptidyl-prolyl cis-trans isomerase C
VRSIILALTLAAATGLAACEPTPAEPPVPGALELGDDVLVTVDGHKVTQKVLDIGTRNMPAAQREQLMSNPEQKKELIERMAFAELLYQRALTEGLHKSEEARENFALANREILANMMLEQIGKAAVTDAAVQEKYTSMAVQFNRPSAQVQHILIQAQDEANKLVEQLKNGEIDFLDAAKKYSIDRGIQQHGGDLGWTPRAPIRELQEAWETAPIGEIVGPVEGRLGFHIIRIQGRRDATPLEEVRDGIEEMLKVEAMKGARADMMSKSTLVWPGGAPGATPDADPTKGATVAPPGAEGGVEAGGPE